jgi:glyoxylase-like metal-dependent hydrolase (beta-lactamase superfamily II)
METRVTEVADGIYRLSTYVPDADLGFNQFLVVGDEPFLFHCGQRALFGAVSAAAATVLPIERLRWISFGHTEADECGAMNQWLAAAPNATVAFGALGVAVSVNDLADRPPRPLEDGEVLDLGAKRVRYLAAPHVPHGWDAGLFYEETTNTLFAGDLFTQSGDRPTTSVESPMEATIAAEELFGYTTLTPSTASTIERLARLEPSTLAHARTCLPRRRRRRAAQPGQRLQRAHGQGDRRRVGRGVTDRSSRHTGGPGAGAAASASRPQASIDSCSGRASGATPASSNCAAVTAPASERRNILRRCRNARCTSGNSTAGSASTAGDRRRTMRTSTESTRGWGTKTVGGTVATTSASAQ